MRARQRKTPKKGTAPRVVYFKIDEAEYEALRTIAVQEERPVASVIRRFLREALARRVAA